MWEPSRDAAAIRGVIVSELRTQDGLLVRDHEQVRGEHERCCVGEQRERSIVQSGAG